MLDPLQKADGEKWKDAKYQLAMKCLKFSEEESSLGVPAPALRNQFRSQFVEKIRERWVKNYEQHAELKHELVVILDRRLASESPPPDQVAQVLREPECAAIVDADRSNVKQMARIQKRAHRLFTELPLSEHHRKWTRGLAGQGMEGTLSQVMECWREQLQRHVGKSPHSSGNPERWAAQAQSRVGLGWDPILHTNLPYPVAALFKNGEEATRLIRMGCPVYELKGQYVMTPEFHAHIRECCEKRELHLYCNHLSVPKTTSSPLWGLEDVPFLRVFTKPLATAIEGASAHESRIYTPALQEISARYPDHFVLLELPSELPQLDANPTNFDQLHAALEDVLLLSNQHLVDHYIPRDTLRSMFAEIKERADQVISHVTSADYQGEVPSARAILSLLMALWKDEVREQLHARWCNSTCTDGAHRAGLFQALDLLILMERDGSFSKAATRTEWLASLHAGPWEVDKEPMQLNSFRPLKEIVQFLESLPDADRQRLLSPLQERSCVVQVSFYPTNQRVVRIPPLPRRPGTKKSSPST